MQAHTSYIYMYMYTSYQQYRNTQLCFVHYCIDMHLQFLQLWIHAHCNTKWHSSLLPSSFIPMAQKVLINSLFQTRPCTPHRLPWQWTPEPQERGEGGRVARPWSQPSWRTAAHYAAPSHWTWTEGPLASWRSCRAIRNSKDCTQGQIYNRTNILCNRFFYLAI